jgi:hypothetical protein
MAKVRITKEKYESILTKMGENKSLNVYLSHKDYAGRPQFDENGKQKKPATIRQHYVESDINTIEIHIFHDKSPNEFYQFV